MDTRDVPEVLSKVVSPLFFEVDDEPRVGVGFGVGFGVGDTDGVGVSQVILPVVLAVVLAVVSPAALPVVIQVLVLQHTNQGGKPETPTQNIQTQTAQDILGRQISKRPMVEVWCGRLARDRW